MRILYFPPLCPFALIDNLKVDLPMTKIIKILSEAMDVKKINIMIYLMFLALIIVQLSVQS